MEPKSRESSSGRFYRRKQIIRSIVDGRIESSFHSIWSLFGASSVFSVKNNEKQKFQSQKGNKFKNKCSYVLSINLSETRVFVEDFAPRRSEECSLKFWDFEDFVRRTSEESSLKFWDFEDFEDVSLQQGSYTFGDFLEELSSKPSRLFSANDLLKSFFELFELKFPLRLFLVSFWRILSASMRRSFETTSGKIRAS